MRDRRHARDTTNTHQSAGAADMITDAVPAQRTSSQATKGTQRPRKSLLSLDDLYVELGIAKSTFYDWRAKGRAPKCIKLPNGEIRIRRTELERWLNELEAAA